MVHRFITGYRFPKKPKSKAFGSLGPVESHWFARLTRVGQVARCIAWTELRVLGIVADELSRGPPSPEATQCVGEILMAHESEVTPNQPFHPVYAFGDFSEAVFVEQPLQFRSASTAHFF